MAIFFAMLLNDKLTLQWFALGNLKIDTLEKGTSKFEKF